MQDLKPRRRRWQVIAVSFLAVTIGGFCNRAWSEDVAPPTQATPSDLEQRVRILERKLELANEETVAKAKETVSLRAGPEGFQIQSGDKNFALKIRALIQADARFFIDDNAGNETNSFLVRRARPILEGTLFGFSSFRLAPDLAGNGKTTLFDAYLDLAPWTFLKFRAGKFKPPIGLEHLQSDENLTFAERAFPSVLVPSRDTGVQVFGDLFNGALSYAASFTNGVGDNNVNTTATAPVTSDADTNDGKEGTARIAAKPFKHTTTALQGLGIGLSASYAKQAGVSPTYVSPGQLSLFSAATGALPDGEHSRIAPDLQWYYRSLGLYGDWVQSSQVWRVGQTRSRLVNQAWQAAGSYVLTGEDATYSGVKPRKPFNPASGTWGALELAARYQQLYLDPDHWTQGITTAGTAVQRASAYGIGLNWYLNANFRFTTDFDETNFDKGAAVGDRPNEKVVISRWQLVF